jgi:hypothetical protein
MMQEVKEIQLGRWSRKPHWTVDNCWIALRISKFKLVGFGGLNIAFIWHDLEI